MKLSTWYLLLWLPVFAGCGADYNGDNRFATVSGKVFYQGTRLYELNHWALGVSVLAELTGEVIPHSTRLYMEPEIPEDGFEYQLRNIEPYTYFLVAQLVDLEKEGDLLDTVVGMGLLFELEILPGDKLEEIDIILGDM